MDEKPRLAGGPVSFMLRTLPLTLFALFLLPPGSRGEVTNEAIVRATAAIQAAVPRAQADPAQPIFHVMSPAQWMNDPNGPIFYKGYYHLFYQLHPFSDGSGPKYWGHVRSRDLVKWEPLAHRPRAVRRGGRNGSLVRLLHAQRPGRADVFLHEHRSWQTGRLTTPNNGPPSAMLI